MSGLDDKGFVRVDRKILERLIDLLKNYCDLPELCVEELVEGLIRLYLLTVKFLKKSPSERNNFVMQILRVLDKNYKDGVPIEEILRFSQYFLISERYVRRVIAYNKAIGTLYEPKKGRIKIL